MTATGDGQEDAIRALAERVHAFAMAEARKIRGEHEPEAVGITALVHACGMGAADAAGPGADFGRLVSVADAAAGQVFNATHMWHALRTSTAPEGATVQ